MCAYVCVCGGEGVLPIYAVIKEFTRPTLLFGDFQLRRCHFFIFNFGVAAGASVRRRHPRSSTRVERCTVDADPFKKFRETVSANHHHEGFVNSAASRDILARDHHVKSRLRYLRHSH